ncbi:hypothetical protein L1049_022608 [Liquidambar formosana]|uniref:GH18 domain-containing protein n=1 Tax=Liquidambar formosana TaxID=63359 RepID=A0AAP0RCP2_LIQFO
MEINSSSMASKLIAFLLFFLPFELLHHSNAQSWIKSGYWQTASALAAHDINSALFTHLICGFAGIDNSTYHLSIPSSDVPLFSNFTHTVKSKNPSIVTLLSIWAGRSQTAQSISGQTPNSTVLSSMASQASYRKSFIESSIKTARLYGFHGLGPMLGLADELPGGFNTEERGLGPCCSIRVLLVFTVNPDDNGLGAPATGWGLTIDVSMAYKAMKSLIRGYGKEIAIVYNATYVVNYFSVGVEWMGYDDVEAIRAKVSYAKERQLLGYIVFEISYDENWVLSQAAAQMDVEDHQYKLQLFVIMLPIAMVIFALVFVKCYCRRRILKSKEKQSLSGGGIEAAENLNCNAPNLEVFSFADIVAATNNFLIENKLGEGWIWTSLQDLDRRLLLDWKKRVQIIEGAYELLKDGKGMEFMDPSLDDAASSCKLMTCMQVALLCVQEKPTDRPSMLEVFAMLKNETAAITMPKRPAFSRKRDQDEGNNSTLEHAVCSNEATISLVLPR